MIIVDFHKQISNDTNLNIIIELVQKGSEKDITRRNSSNHVNRILNSFFMNILTVLLKALITILNKSNILLAVIENLVILK